jgi:hypothetical protein
MNQGWIKLHRKTLDHWLYTESRPHTKREAWEDMLLLCNHTDEKVLVNGELIDCKRGQSIMSLKTWAKTFKWTIQQVRTFFKLLKNDKMINTEGLRKTTRITICNYDYYQNNQQADNTENNTQITHKQQADNTQITTNKNDKNVKNEKKDDFIAKIIHAFRHSYFKINNSNYEILAIGKERAAASKVLSIYKEKYPDANSDEVLEGLNLYFEECCSISDEWMQKNMSLSLIVSKFNEINTTIKKQQNGKKVKSVAERSGEICNIIDAVYKKKETFPKYEEI